MNRWSTSNLLCDYWASMHWNIFWFW